jgi:hypothetical protein
LTKSGRDQVRRRHGAVGAVVVLVEDDAVEAQLLTVGHLVEVFSIVTRALDWVEIAAGYRSTRRFGRNMGICQEIKVIDLHRIVLLGNFVADASISRLAGSTKAFPQI